MESWSEQCQAALAYMYVYIYDCRDKTLTRRFADISFVYQVFLAMIRMRYQ